MLLRFFCAVFLLFFFLTALMLHRGAIETDDSGELILFSGVQ